MKKKYQVILTFAVIIFGVIYTANVHSKKREAYWENKKETEEVIREDTTQPVAKTQEPCVQKDMKYTLILEHESTGKNEFETKTMPDEFLGLRRNELIDYLQEKTKDSYASKEAKDRIHYELISFSSSGITIKETILANPDVYTCFVIAEGEFVNIYTADRTALYMDTMLYRKDFSEDVQGELARGIYMETVMDLYDFLQNHTS
ncbi:MAG: hypothetical protein IKU83_04420 [Lachnospiraceae bacterium]|nr:hypothetical protein [Lachnospiraceae bacterium]